MFLAINCNHSLIFKVFDLFLPTIGQTVNGLQNVSLGLKVGNYLKFTGHWFGATKLVIQQGKEVPVCFQAIELKFKLRLGWIVTSRLFTVSKIVVRQSLKLSLFLAFGNFH